MTWRVAALASFAFWGLALHLAIIAVGPSGYYSDLASTPWYLIGWLLFSLGCEFLTRFAKPTFPRAALALRFAWPVAIGPEVLLTVPITASSIGLFVVGKQAYYYLDQFVFVLQLPGYGLLRLFGGSYWGRWRTGLVDPPTLSTLMDLVILNLANLVGWALLFGAIHAACRMVATRKIGVVSEPDA